MASRASSLLLLALLPACNGGEKTTADVTATMATTDATTTAPATTEPTPGGETSTTTGTATTDTPIPTTDVTTAADTTTTPTTDATTTTTGVMPGPCEGEAPRIRLSTTMGDLVVQLDAVNAPLTTANFLHYVESGFYDGTIFHRTIDDFVIQGGGLLPDLSTKPTDPPIPLETSPALTHVDGAISMARTNDPNSATSQFFLCDGPQHFLDGDYAAFGVLVEGFDVLAAIAAVPTASENGYDDVPVTDVIVNSAACE
ncbi:Peptidyl-prolyl cis-trans isomerase (rotamase)-cyclophilin family [Nannocystis exedens]|uniref:Peptidyl-prolyl cis-trans isomerase n=1 Tax=Nannocystis exedens TaxID=54 RepID=A0A1I2END2_9BACT|nr:peptidylprolyl isomerase [Nannocystis exedens]PCC73930.1 peptidylprolyl isomerase [Nannocystis exedens]SFE94097.1 Peptidyl-prolyl cis-trans isomerase (rotamase)-cyclophilin family [Nannocystis exedens]